MVLPEPCSPRQQHDRRRFGSVGNRKAFAAEDGYQLVADDLDYLLCGVEGLMKLGGKAFFAHSFAEFLHHAHIHIGVYKGFADVG